jgi:hypothetical protein
VKQLFQVVLRLAVLALLLAVLALLVALPPISSLLNDPLLRQAPFLH